MFPYMKYLPRRHIHRCTERQNRRFSRTPTHTDRLLDQSSYNQTSHKATTIRTLTRRAQVVCDSPDSLQDETDYLNITFLVRTITTRTLESN